MSKPSKHLATLQIARPTLVCLVRSFQMPFAGAEKARGFDLGDGVLPTSPREKARCVHVYVGRCREDSNVVLSHDHTDVPIDSTVRLTCSHRSIVSKAL